MSERTVSKSLYLHDPDGNEMERYVDANEAVWKNNPQAMNRLIGITIQWMECV